MKTRRGKQAYKLPHLLYRVTGIVIDERMKGGNTYPIELLQAVDITRMTSRDTAPRRPDYAWVDGSVIRFYPIPDGTYNVRIRYIEHEKEF